MATVTDNILLYGEFTKAATHVEDALKCIRAATSEIKYLENRSDTDREILAIFRKMVVQSDISLTNLVNEIYTERNKIIEKQKLGRIDG